MSTVFSILAVILLLVVGLWLAVFGGNRTSIGWEDTATIQFLSPFRTGGSLVQATAPLPASPREIEDGEEDEGEGPDPSDDLV